jgi:hypothetical protein
MDENFSRVVFIYGMAIVLGLGKACTLLIWRTLPRTRPGVRQEVREAWQGWIQRRSSRRATAPLTRGGEPQLTMPAPAALDELRQP